MIKKREHTSHHQEDPVNSVSVHYGNFLSNFRLWTPMSEHSIPKNEEKGEYYEEVRIMECRGVCWDIQKGKL